MYQRLNPQNQTDGKVEAERNVDCFVVFWRVRVSGLLLAVELSFMNMIIEEA